MWYVCVRACARARGHGAREQSVGKTNGCHLQGTAKRRDESNNEANQICLSFLGVSARAHDRACVRASPAHSSASYATRCMVLPGVAAPGRRMGGRSVLARQQLIPSLMPSSLATRPLIQNAQQASLIFAPPPFPPLSLHPAHLSPPIPLFFSLPL